MMVFGGKTGAEQVGAPVAAAISQTNSRPKYRYALLRPMLDACAAFGLFVVVSLMLSSGPTSASPYRYRAMAAGLSQSTVISPAIAEDKNALVVEIATAATPSGAVYKRTTETAAWALLSFAFSVLAAMNMALFRHLRQAYAAPRRRPKS